MMKIAIAGTNGLSQFIAFYLAKITSHSFVLLSRMNGSRFKAQDWQIIKIDYSNHKNLVYTLAGVDLVISTISDSAQLQLIDAAAEAEVKHFIPSSFSGPSQCSPSEFPNKEWKQVIERLSLYEQTGSMRYTIISCGVFYERFGPGGLDAFSISSGQSQHQAISHEGAFLVDPALGTANVPLSSKQNQAVHICMTSARDAARYLVAALQAQQDLGCWPNEFVFYTERISAIDLVDICASAHGIPIIPNYYMAENLTTELQTAIATENSADILRLKQLIATAEGAFDRAASEVNLFPDMLPAAGTREPAEQFVEWLASVWNKTEQIPSSRATSRS